MAHRTLTRADLLQVVYVTGPVLDTLCNTLEQGESVKLRGFGTFNVRSKRPRVGRNPKTGHEYPITARRVLTFKPSPRLIAAVNGEVAEPGADEDDPGDSRQTARPAVGAGTSAKTGA